MWAPATSSSPTWHFSDLRSPRERSIPSACRARMRSAAWAEENRTRLRPLPSSDRQLCGQLEVLHPVDERPTHPCLEGGLVVGDGTASGKPDAVEPLQGAEF